MGSPVMSCWSKHRKDFLTCCKTTAADSIDARAVVQSSGFSLPVFMRMVHVRHVRVSVFQSAVTVRMGVRFAGRIVGAVFVLMMRIMHVGMRVFHGFMNVLMFVVLGDVQPYADRHQQPRHQQLKRERLTQEYYGHDCAKKRCRRKVGACARSTEMAQR
jgi:hypothetical protein